MTSIIRNVSRIRFYIDAKNTGTSMIKRFSLPVIGTIEPLRRKPSSGKGKLPSSEKLLFDSDGRGQMCNSGELTYNPVFQGLMSDHNTLVM
jgi:hypothetical protein